MSEPFAVTLPPALVQAIAQQAAAIVLQQLATTESESPYLTIPEAAAYLRCKRQRIDDLLSARRLQRLKDGRRTLILRAELDAYLAGRNAPTADPRPGRDGDWIEPASRATVTHPGNRTTG